MVRFSDPNRCITAYGRRQSGFNAVPVETISHMGNHGGLGVDCSTRYVESLATVSASSTAKRNPDTDHAHVEGERTNPCNSLALTSAHYLILNHEGVWLSNLILG